MIDWRQISCGSDCTGAYVVDFTKGMTVGQFIQEMLTDHKSECGYIGIFKPHSIFGDPCMSYSHGKANSMLPKEYLDKVILKADGSGGWSRSDFRLYI